MKWQSWITIPLAILFAGMGYMVHDSWSESMAGPLVRVNAMGNAVSQETSRKTMAEPCPEFAAVEAEVKVEKANAESTLEQAPASKIRKGTAPFLGAGVRGFVNKSGTLPAAYYLPVDEGVRKKSYEEWLSNYLDEGHLTGHSALPYPHCQVYVNHHYRFVWIKGHKVGSTSMRESLGWLCEDDWRLPENLTESPYCSEPAFENGNLTAGDVVKWWSDYFVFGIVRNPYTRFASAEEYIGGKIKKPCERPSFEDTCHEPYVHVKTCSQCNCGWGGSVVHHYRHFMDQATCLFTESLRPAVDFIGEVENAAEDLATIVDEINKRRDPELPPLSVKMRNDNTHRQLKTDHSYAYDLFQDHQFCLKGVSDFYYKDFLLLDYQQLDHLVD